MKTILVALLLAPCAALADPPDACGLLTLDEVNAIAQNKAVKAVPQQSGNPTKCNFVDAHRGAVLVVSAREVQYAVRDEMFHEKENLEKIYKQRSKPLETIGEGGFWLAATHQLTFRKARTIATVTFATPKNQNEADTAQMAHLVESRLVAK